jgi:hypothetical protein
MNLSLQFNQAIFILTTGKDESEQIHAGCGVDLR